MPRNISDHKLTMAIADTLKSARMKRGLNQQQLALRMKVTKNWVSRVERGLRPCNLGTLCRFAFALETQPWNLLRCAELRLAPAAKPAVFAPAQTQPGTMNPAA